MHRAADKKRYEKAKGIYQFYIDRDALGKIDKRRIEGNPAIRKLFTSEAAMQKAIKNFVDKGPVAAISLNKYQQILKEYESTSTRHRSS
jgi:hypothetical protein